MKVIIEGKAGMENQRLTLCNEYIDNLICLEIDTMNQPGQQAILIEKRDVKELINALRIIVGEQNE